MVDRSDIYAKYLSRNGIPRCSYCNSEISMHEKFVYSRTKRKSDMFICEKCVSEYFPKMIDTMKAESFFV